MVDFRPWLLIHQKEDIQVFNLLGLHQDASAARRLQFDDVSNPAALD